MSQPLLVLILILFSGAVALAYYNYRHGQPFFRALFYALLMMLGLAFFILGAFGKHF